jgi:ankyrin repeat protein
VSAAVASAPHLRAPRRAGQLDAVCAFLDLGISPSHTHIKCDPAAALICFGANFPARSLSTPLHIACKYNHFHVAQELLLVRVAASCPPPPPPP